MLKRERNNDISRQWALVSRWELKRANNKVHEPMMPLRKQNLKPGIRKANKKLKLTQKLIW